MSKKAWGGTLLFLGLIGIIGAFGVLNDQKEQAAEHASSMSSVAKERSESAKKESVKNAKKLASVSQALEENVTTSSVSSTTVSESDPRKVTTPEEASRVALEYYKSLGHDTNGFDPRAKMGEIVNSGDSYAVPIYDTPQHYVEVDVDKSTGEATALSLETDPMASTSSASDSNSSSSVRFTDMDAASKAKEMVTDPGYKYVSTQLDNDGNYQVNFRYGENQYPSTVKFDQYGNYLGRDGFDN